MNRKKTYFFILAALTASQSSLADFPGQWSGGITAEFRYFPEEGVYANSEQQVYSVILSPEYTYAWDNDRQVISFLPFYRYDDSDEQREHGDIRELSLVSSFESFEFRFGISKVFWGVTESAHLVDVINQTDLVENPDAEDKLGQPMINTTLVSDWGNLDLFLLPYFRERSFPGQSGRYRSAVVVDTERAEYLHEDGQQHIDIALRWSQTWNDLDWALSYFKGTDREPMLRLDSSQNVAIPVYGQSEQIGLEIQYIYLDLLAKAELLEKDSFQFGSYRAAVVGGEYTFANIYNGMDIGVLYEWLYDNRKMSALLAYRDASFLGSRMAFNNADSSEILLGAILDNKTQNPMLYRLEASHRISSSVSADLEINIIDDAPADSLLGAVRQDDYVQLSFSKYF